MNNKVLEDIYNFWYIDDALNKRWFVKNKVNRNKVDKYILNNFSRTLIFLKKIDSKSLVKYIKYKLVKSRLNLRHILSIIICLDQFSRHIYRENKTRLQINKNTKKAK